MKRYIIACSGAGERWGDHLGVPKHFIKIDDEPILHRTVRLIQQNDKNCEICIMAFTDNYKIKDTILCKPTLFKNHYSLPAILTSKEFWGEEDTVLLFGDVYFTDSAINTITNTKSGEGSPIIFFGRRQKSNITLKNYGEIFGVYFTKKNQEVLLKVLNILHNKFETQQIPRFITWEVYGFKDLVSKSFVEIDDLTDDFDFPKDYYYWIKQYNLFKQIKN